jgi:hypothetical protein
MSTGGHGECDLGTRAFPVFVLEAMLYMQPCWSLITVKFHFIFFCRFQMLALSPVCCSMRRRDVLRESARQEFEAARHERDPEIVNRLLVVGRDSVHKVAERFAKKHVEQGQTLPPPQP